MRESGGGPVSRMPDSNLTAISSAPAGQQDE
jgi:hypothetical protein